MLGKCWLTFHFKLLAKEKGLQRIYGKIPPGRDLLYHQLEVPFLLYKLI